MQPTTPTFAGMEDCLRDACERATQLVFPLLTMLRLYRSVVSLTRALMQARTDAGLSANLSDDLIARLEQVRDTIGLHFPEPDMPVNDALRLHAATVAVARAAHRARAGKVRGRLPRAKPSQPAAASPPAPAEFEILPPDDDTLSDTPQPVDFRVKVLNGDPTRDFMSRRYGPNDDMEAAYAEALRQSTADAADAAYAPELHEHAQIPMHRENR